MIKKYLWKFFSKNTHNNNSIGKDHIAKHIEGIPDENSVSVVIDRYYRPIIRINIQNIDTLSAQKFAESLFLLNKGFYQLQTIDILKELAISDQDRASFITKVIGYWAEYADTYISDDSPCVSPTSFSKTLTN